LFTCLQDHACAAACMKTGPQAACTCNRTRHLALPTEWQRLQQATRFPLPVRQCPTQPPKHLPCCSAEYVNDVSTLACKTFAGVDWPYSGRFKRTGATEWVAYCRKCGLSRNSLLMWCAALTSLAQASGLAAGCCTTGVTGHAWQPPLGMCRGRVWGLATSVPACLGVQSLPPPLTGCSPRLSNWQACCRYGRAPVCEGT